MVTIPDEELIKKIKLLIQTNDKMGVSRTLAAQCLIKLIREAMPEKRPRLKNPRWMYYEPISDNSVYTRILSEKTMAHEAKQAILQSRGICYLNDQDAVLDFIAVHWCVPYNPHP